jgi:hypothetical protein
MFDYQSLVLLAFSRFQQRDNKGLQRCLENLQHALDRAPQSRRLQRFTSVVKVFSLMLHKQMAAVVAEVRKLFGDLHEPGLDIEAACNLLALLSQLTAGELVLDGSEGWVDSLGMRFASSKGLTELLAGATSAHPPFGELVRAAHTRIGELAEQAVTHTVQGNHRAAAQTLIAHAEKTLNAKLIDMARMTLQRHGSRVDDAAALSARAEALRERYAAGVSVAMLGQSSGRQPGALSLREAKAPEPAATLPAAA